MTFYRLKLTVASEVYILEPQWNPMVEKQAIARVARLGQMRDVKVKRYIMRNTFEEVRRNVADSQLLIERFCRRSNSTRCERRDLHPLVGKKITR